MQIVHCLVRRPSLLKEDLDDRMLPLVEYLESLKLTHEQQQEIIVR